MPRQRPGRQLGFITTMSACRQGDALAIHVATGRVADQLARHFDRVYLCAPAVDGPPAAATDLTLQARNIELIPQPPYASTVGGLKYVVSIPRAYARVCQKADVIFVRGLCPYIGALYLLAFLYRRQVCHWIVGNPVALLKSHTRRGWLLDSLALAYAWQDRLVTRAGRWLTGGAFVCNGKELGAAYRSPRTLVTASSTVMRNEFFEREDTCQGERIRILFVGYIRPEKGVEYLLQAVAKLKTPRPWELVLIGPDEFPAYRKRLNEVIGERQIGDRVHWQGYVSFGEPMFAQMRAADLLVLPTLSEGTPHVLVEARATSLPIVATNVGGIPTTVTDGVDALLVPPKDPAALAAAIDRIIEDGELRRALIRNGLRSARHLTVDRFAELVQSVLEDRRRAAYS